MTTATRSAHAFAQTGAFSALVNLFGILDEHTFVTKTGDLLATRHIVAIWKVESNWQVTVP